MAYGAASRPQSPTCTSRAPLCSRTAQITAAVAAPTPTMAGSTLNVKPCKPLARPPPALTFSPLPSKPRHVHLPITVPSPPPPPSPHTPSLKPGESWQAEYVIRRHLQYWDAPLWDRNSGQPLPPWVPPATGGDDGDDDDITLDEEETSGGWEVP